MTAPQTARAHCISLGLSSSSHRLRCGSVIHQWAAEDAHPCFCCHSSYAYSWTAPFRHGLSHATEPASDVQSMAVCIASHRVALGSPDRPLGVPNHRLWGWESHPDVSGGATCIAAVAVSSQPKSLVPGACACTNPAAIDYVTLKPATRRRQHVIALLTTAFAEGLANPGFASAVTSVVSAGEHLASSQAQLGKPRKHPVSRTTSSLPCKHPSETVEPRAATGPVTLIMTMSGSLCQPRTPISLVTCDRLSSHARHRMNMSGAASIALSTKVSALTVLSDRQNAATESSVS